VTLRRLGPGTRRIGLVSRAAYAWLVVALLWFCGFFNYADRQALSAVLPQVKGEFRLSDTQLGLLASAFMVMYALASPLTGYTVDLLSRRVLIAVGLAFWSLICAATAFSRNFLDLVLLRGSEGLGESFYFPASMSILADYHGPRTRSRAMSIHQTSVYLGTAGGWLLGGALGERHGWRWPFLSLGLAGTAYALFLGACLAEPARGQSADGEIPERGPEFEDEAAARVAAGRWGDKVLAIVSDPAAALLLGVFLGANFVAATFLAWLPSFVGRAFELGLSDSSVTSMLWPLASLPGAVCGGLLADAAARRSRGGRIRVQALGLVLAAPFVFLTGWSSSIPILVVALAGAGLCKGLYDANIFASLYDVVRPADRGTAAGLMNTVGWTGGFIAPTVVGTVSEHLTLGVAITCTSAVYLLVGVLALLAARLVEERARAAIRGVS
jgi:MFS family permease